MSPQLSDDFDRVERAVASGGAASALDLLAQKFIAERQYPLLFETRLMQKRLELGLPLIQLGPIEDLPEPERSSFEDAVREAARETGALFLSLGDIPHAWPYFRAVGDRATIAAAIENAAFVEQSAEQMDALIDIALNQRVHPQGLGTADRAARHLPCDYLLRTISGSRTTRGMPDPVGAHATCGVDR
ncbi:MAG: hypothetical protein JOZ32_19635 [Bryobacterales bacterium]|nr:hypothetical protein [Bryobacterales bacterium]